MKILVIGSGGREHAIAKKFLESSLVENVFVAPGNAGMKIDGIEPVAIDENDFASLARFAVDNDIEFTFVGPEVPLMNGIVDDFEARGLKIFGPRKNAAMIEGSKDFAKEIMVKNNVPTASYKTFTDFDEANTYVLNQKCPIVIKADGLAAGKGVVIAETTEEATKALFDMLSDNRFGDAGARVVVEEFLDGIEFSLFSFVDGENVWPLMVSQDHKRAYDNDKGPNTGGMGAYAPIPESLVSVDVIQQAVDTIVVPTAKGMVANGTPFTGVLYAGLILTEEGPKVIEYNARFGDPETQVVLPRMTSDLAQVVLDILNRKSPEISFDVSKYSLGVVIASDGYPGDYAKGASLPDFSDDDVSVIYAGVKEVDGELKANGGRVLLVEASAETIEEAQEKVYKVLDSKKMNGLFYRHDIGGKAVVKS
jgi:phosphoribosylamine--glycine ligase